LDFDFVADDQPLIVHNPYIRSWQFSPSFFLTDAWHVTNPKAAGSYYRPAFLLWLLVNYKLFGLHPYWWHWTTLGLHLCSTLLVYLLIRKLTAQTFVAGTAALLFGLHPVHIESAAWVLGANEALLAVFFLASFLCYLIWRNMPETNQAVRRWFIASMLLYGVALFVKETAVLEGALVFAYEWLFRPPVYAEAADFG